MSTRRIRDYSTSWFWHTTQQYNREKACSHRKGGCLSLHADYNVSLHRFPTGEWRIRCMTCGWEVWNRPGWEYKWASGMKMVNDSTNSPTASETVKFLQPGLPVNANPRLSEPPTYRPYGPMVLYISSESRGNK